MGLNPFLFSFLWEGDFCRPLETFSLVPKQENMKSGRKWTFES